MRAGRRIFALSGALLLAALATGAIVAAQPGARDRHRTVAGWLVESVAEEDGGRLVRMTRTSGPYRLEYHAAFWHGNDGVIQRVSATGAGCGSDDELDRHLIVHVREIRARLAAGLAECAAPPSAVRAALRGLDPAYALARAWHAHAFVATHAEAAAIAADGAVPRIIVDPPCDPAANASADLDITEMNATQAAAAACSGP